MISIAMKKFLEIVFCKIYGILKEEFNAMGLLTVLLSINIFTVVGYYKTLFLKESNFLLPLAYEIIIIIIVGIISWIIFLKDDKFKSIYKRYKQNPSMNGAKGSWVTGSYIIITLGMLVSLIWLGMMNMKSN